MSRYVLLRLLETFFRRWWLLLVPIVLLAGVGVASASTVPSKYESVGTINSATDTVLDSLNSTSQNFGYDTPASATSNDIGQLLRTGDFIRRLATTAGLSSALESGAITFDAIRSSISVYASGQNLVRVSSVYEDPRVALALATATIDTYIQTRVDTAVAGSEVAIEVFNDLVTTYQAEVDAAQLAFDQYVREHPQQLDGTYSAEDTVQINRLQSTLDAAQGKLDGALGKLDDATLSKAQAETAINQQLQVIDEPELPAARQAKVKKMVITFGMFLAIGVMLSVGLLIAAAALDRTVRFPVDAQQRLGVPAIAAIPTVRRRRTG